MGEDTTEAYERHTVRDAADILGITTGAVRSRLSRRTLRSERVEGTVYVLLPRRQSGDTSSDTSSDMLADELRDRLAFVERQLEAERQAHAEARRIIAGLVERLPPALEAPQGPVSSADASEGTRSPDAAGEAQEGSERPQRRSWWREFFGI